MEGQTQGAVPDSLAHLDTVDHPKDALPGNIVAGLEHDVTLSNIGTRLPVHAAWLVPNPDPGSPSRWIQRGTFRLFVAHDTAPAVSSDAKAGDGVHVFHGAIASAAKAAGLKVKCVAITVAGAELEFSK